MLASMTGFGEARFQSEAISLSVELRALNNRHLKVTVRAPEPFNLLEAEFEKVVRRDVKRGAIQINLRIDKRASPGDFRINEVALKSYLGQLADMGLSDPAFVAALLPLPGVVAEPGGTNAAWQDDWPLIEKTLTEAIKKLNAMRQSEGRAMATELVAQRNAIAERLDAIRRRAPEIVVAYRERLHERIRSLLAAHDVALDRDSLLREVAIFAERSDIAEETVRLGAHLDHFLEILDESDGPGRKLDFLIQEMFRETNTIGSKANDVAVAKEVVAIKQTLEQIRELIQNVE